MKRYPQSFVCLTILGIALQMAAGCRTVPHASESPITPGEISRRGQVGRLGIPFGEVVQVDATLIDGYTLRQRYYAYKMLLRVESISGTELESPFLMLFEDEHHGTKIPSDLSDLQDIAESHGDADTTSIEAHYLSRHYTLLVYETGRYIGTPFNMPEGYLERASPSFSWESSLVIVSILADEDLAQAPPPVHPNGD